MGGFRYKMRLVHAHFPINVVVPKDGKNITIKNFLGGKQDKFIQCRGDTKVTLSADVKGELIFDGTDIAAISLTCSQADSADLLDLRAGEGNSGDVSTIE